MRKKDIVLISTLYITTFIFFYRFYDFNFEPGFFYIEFINLLFFAFAVIMPIYYFLKLMSPSKNYILHFILSSIPIFIFVMLGLVFFWGLGIGSG